MSRMGPKDLQVYWDACKPNDVVFIRAVADAGELALSVDINGGRSLLIPVANEPSVESSGARAAVQMRVAHLKESDGTRKPWLAVQCVESQFFNQFDLLICDIIGEGTIPGSSPARYVADVLQRWRAMLKVPVLALSQSQQVGLFGELSVALDLVEILDVDISSWVGPLESRHDFRFAHAAVEVKSSAGQKGTVEIHGREQLSVDGVDRLFLVHVLVDDAGIDGESVFELGQRLLNATSSKIACADLARRSGIDLAGAAPDGLKRYSVRSKTWYEVLDGFPRLSEDQLGPVGLLHGIHDLRYSVDLHSVDPGLVRDEEIVYGAITERKAT